MLMVAIEIVEREREKRTKFYPRTFKSVHFSTATVDCRHTTLERSLLVDRRWVSGPDMYCRRAKARTMCLARQTDG